MARSKARRLVLTLVAATPLLAACNAIIGLSDFSKGECPGGGVCYDDASADVVSPGDGGDGGRDGGPNIVDAQGTVPVSWAKFVMPNYPQDGAPPATIPTYGQQAGNKEPALTDSVSKLVWRPVPTEEKTKEYTFSEAEKLCASAKTDIGKWRLPTRIELVTLLDFSKGPPTADPGFGLSNDQYWTTSFQRLPGPRAESAIQTTDRLVVGFGGGSATIIGQLGEAETAKVICIQTQ